jgi:hypothetical protein
LPGSPVKKKSRNKFTIEKKERIRGVEFNWKVLKKEEEEEGE